MYVYLTTELPLEKIVNRQIRCIVGNVEVTNAERAPQLSSGTISRTCRGGGGVGMSSGTTHTSRSMCISLVILYICT